MNNKYAHLGGRQLNRKSFLKELKAYFQVKIHAKITMPDSQRYP